MAERPVPDALAHLDLASIADVGARQAIRALLDLVEELAAENQALRAENQQLRDELTRLKGGSGATEAAAWEVGRERERLLVGAGAAVGAENLAEARQARPDPDRPDRAGDGRSGDAAT